MSLAACAGLVERADPDRFRAIMAAPVAARTVLFPVFAFNVEVSRAPWVTQEDMIAEMRLQWWRDALEEIAQGGPARRHEVVDALAVTLDASGARTLDRLVEARRWDCYRDAHPDDASLDAYLDATSGDLMWTAARLLGADKEAPVRDFAYAAGVAGWLRAVPELERQGRRPLVDGTPAGVRALAERAEGRRAAAVAARGQVPARAGAALLSGWRARPVLARVRREPGLVAAEALGDRPLRDALRLARVATRGWWV